MIFQGILHPTLSDSPHGSRVADLGALTDETVSIRLGKKRGDPSVISINCTDQLGLGCELARILFEFGLDVVRGDISTDGRWCFVLFWVRPRLASSRPIQWALMKKRLVSACPSPQASLLLPLIPHPNQKKELYRLQICSADRSGLLNDITQTLWELELDVHAINVSTTPDGRSITLFYITDVRNALQKKRQEEVCNRLRGVLRDSCFFCELQPASPEFIGLDGGLASSLPASVADDLFNERPIEPDSAVGIPQSTISQLSANIDNSLSPGHSLLQIAFRDRTSILYDCMRILKELNIQVAYGRLCTAPKGSGDLDLFILQEDGSKIFDPQKQKELLSRLESDMGNPIRVLIGNRGPETELLVATPVEINGRGRPRVLYDVTLVLKMLEISIFKADIGKLPRGDRQWEVYRFLLAEQPGSTLTSIRTRSHIEERVRNVLMG